MQHLPPMAQDTAAAPTILLLHCVPSRKLPCVDCGHFHAYALLPSVQRTCVEEQQGGMGSHTNFIKECQGIMEGLCRLFKKIWQEWKVPAK